ncbi:MAG TPA: hypothetical protein VFB81_16570 [Myxococcales bacterium]|nr:hypothetical protein [Myxococcales bacterium]
MASRARAAVGFSVHTGWAAAVAVGGSAAEPQVLGRARLELVRPDDGFPRFVFHSVEGRPLAEARKVVERAEQATRRHALEELERFAGEVAQQGAKVVAAGLTLATGKLPAELEAVLRSHPFIHTAEGELFRAAIAHACEAMKVPVERVPRKTLFAQAGQALGKTEAAVKKVVDGMKASLGPPWGADQKEAMALGWIALARGARV